VQIVLTAFFGAVFVYSAIAIIFFRSDKVILKGRFSRYLKTAEQLDAHDQVFKEKHENERKKRSHKLRLAGKQLTNYLAMSGVKLSATEYIVAWAIASLAPMLIVLLFRGSVITAFGVGIVGFSAPPLLVRQSRKKRQEEFNKQLSESVVIMVNCIKAGFSFQQAMESIAADMQPPISTEFAKTLREVHYGISLRDALKHMVDRVKNKDLDLLVTAVLTAVQVGGNLSEILEVIAGTIKDRIRIKGEVRVLTSSGRMSGMVIGLLPVFIIIILMVINPEYFMSFYESPIGKFMLVLSIFLEAIGFALINKIVDIKY
jgi:tight adherence protein B